MGQRCPCCEIEKEKQGLPGAPTTLARRPAVVVETCSSTLLWQNMTTSTGAAAQRPSGTDRPRDVCRKPRQIGGVGDRCTLGPIPGTDARHCCRPERRPFRAPQCHPCIPAGKRPRHGGLHGRYLSVGNHDGRHGAQCGDDRGPHIGVGKLRSCGAGQNRRPMRWPSTTWQSRCKPMRRNPKRASSRCDRILLCAAHAPMQCS